MNRDNNIDRRNNIRPLRRPEGGQPPHAGGRKTSPASPSKTAKPLSSKPVSGVRNAFIRSGDIVRIQGGIDRPMLVIILVLIGYGLIMAFSASYAYSLVKTGDSYYFIKRQLVAVALGFIAMIILIRMDYRTITKFVIPGMLLAVLLLAIVPIVGISQGVAQRWLSIGGISIQPSEFMKIMIILFLALYMERFGKNVIDYQNKGASLVYGAVLPFGMLLVVCALVLLEKHISGTAIIFIIGFAIIFVGGCELIWILFTGLFGTTVLAIVIQNWDYAAKRVDTWLNPEKYSSLDDVWQTIQGLNAIGSGGIFGVGLGNSRQKYMFVSQPQNDFIFPIICEELGLIGAASVIILFILFVWRGYKIASRMPDTFSALTVVGITTHIGFQAALNMLVVTNLFPNTGIALPFFSCGGTSTAMQVAEMGILLCMSKYTYERRS
ncbi:MAG TPA: cell division protein FtsW [Clostridiales bacterium]|jgi:cell division protein FtsW|nr:cell division protein FtsW [Clostridiales bacterium]